MLKEKELETAQDVIESRDDNNLSAALLARGLAEESDRPVLLTTNKDPQQWGAVLHDADLSAAILDRLLHRGEIVKLSGRSRTGAVRLSRPAMTASSRGKLITKCFDRRSSCPLMASPAASASFTVSPASQRPCCQVAPVVAKMLDNFV